jgi:hypothetical protein
LVIDDHIIQHPHHTKGKLGTQLSGASISSKRSDQRCMTRCSHRGSLMLIDNSPAFCDTDWKVVYLLCMRLPARRTWSGAWLVTNPAADDPLISTGRCHGIVSEDRLAACRNPSEFTATSSIRSRVRHSEAVRSPVSHIGQEQKPDCFHAMLSASSATYQTATIGALRRRPSLCAAMPDRLNAQPSILVQCHPCRDSNDNTAQNLI